MVSKWAQTAAEKKARKDRALLTSEHSKSYKIRKKGKFFFFAI